MKLGIIMHIIIIQYKKNKKRKKKKNYNIEKNIPNKSW